MEPNRILLRSVNWLGDAVMTMPAVQRLKEAHPNARLTVLSEPKVADLWRLHADVDEVLVQSRTDNVFTLLRYAREIRQRNFEAAVIFPNSWRSVLAIWLAGVPRRIGFSGHGRAFMLTESLTEASEYQTEPVQRVTDGQTRCLKTYEHQVYRHLELVARLGAKSQPCAARLNAAPAKAEDFPLPSDKPLLALNAGAEFGPAKRWPEERFVAAAKEIADRVAVRWVVIGGPKEKEQGNRIVDMLGKDVAVNLAGQTTLIGLCKLLSRCRLLLTNDSGPMHLAAALGTPVAAIFGSTEPSLTGPDVPETGNSPHVVFRHQPDCSPCFLRECPIDFRCMKSISVQEVVDAVLKQLAH